MGPSMKRLLTFVLAIAFPLAAYSSDFVSGYKDIKFGMNLSQIKNLGVCEDVMPTVGLYECYGRDLFFYEYDTQLILTKEDNNNLSRIVMSVGTYDSTSFDDFTSLLSDKYQQNYLITNKDINQFNSGQVSSIKSIFANGQVELVVGKNSYTGELTMNIRYNDKDLAAKTMKHLKPEKDFGSDDI